MPQLGSRSFRRSTLWLAGFVGVLAGLGLARTGPGFGVAACLVCLLILLPLLRRRGWLALILVSLLGISCGWWRGAVYMHKLAVYEPYYYQKISLTVQAAEDGVYGKTKQLTFGAKGVTLADGQQLVGSIQVSGFGANAIFQGDEVKVTGKLYPGYGSYHGKISFGKLEVVAHHPSWLLEIRSRFVAGASTALPEPLAPFIMGLLVGQRANLPEEVKDDLRTVGLTHIIAVSGANLTIIMQAARRLLGKRSKRITALASLSLLASFILLTGGSASIVRAAIVSTLSILAAYYGRSFKPLNLICFTAVITAIANPIYIWSDLGWYLSFLAFFGVMVVAPLVSARWFKRWGKSIIAGVAIESLCAELMTLPFVLHIFGQMSRVGLLANVLVVTFIPLAMLLGTLAGLIGMLAANIAGWFAWPATIVLNYMLDVAHILANLPDVFVEGIGLDLWQMLCLYICIGLWTSFMWYKNADKSAIITDITDPKFAGIRGVMT